MTVGRLAPKLSAPSFHSAAPFRSNRRHLNDHSQRESDGWSYHAQPRGWSPHVEPIGLVMGCAQVPVKPAHVPPGDYTAVVDYNPCARAQRNIGPYGCGDEHGPRGRSTGDLVGRL